MHKNADLARKRDEQEETVNEQMKEVDYARPQIVQMEREPGAAKAELEVLTKVHDNLLRDINEKVMEKVKQVVTNVTDDLIRKKRGCF